MSQVGPRAHSCELPQKPPFFSPFPTGQNNKKSFTKGLATHIYTHRESLPKLPLPLSPEDGLFTSRKESERETFERCEMEIFGFDFGVLGWKGRERGGGIFD
jgi:hypothetical protein